MFTVEFCVWILIVQRIRVLTVKDKEDIIRFPFDLKTTKWLFVVSTTTHSRVVGGSSPLRVTQTEGGSGSGSGRPSLLRRSVPAWCL